MENKEVLPNTTQVDPDKGLTLEEVLDRKNNHLTNYVKKTAGKSYKEIFLKNIVSFFNILLLIIAVLLIIGKKYTSLFFVVIYLANLIIGIYQDLKAKRLLSKLQLITQPEVRVIRQGKELTIKVDDIVLDDILIVENGNQICADAIIVSGEVGLNESALTGESQVVYKKEGDQIYSGSYVVSGTVKVRVNHVGKDNYVNTLTDAAKKTKATTSEVKKSLDWMFKIIGGMVIAVAILSVIVNWNDLINNFQTAIGPIAGSLVSMIPAGLYLLSSVTFTVGVLSLAKKRTLVQELYSIEALARSTILCLDKTGTITDGTMKVVNVDVIGNYSKADIEMILANHVEATHDNNATGKALKEEFTYQATQTPKYVCPFASENKYSFVTYPNATFALGALDFMDATNKEEAHRKVVEYAAQGYRVLALAKAHNLETGKKINGRVDVIALVVLQDHIKEDAASTIAWFKENDVKIRVISGDDPVTVSHIARKVGIDGAEKYISLSGLSDAEIKEKALNYTVFGRVTPEQKALLVDIFKNSGDKKNKEVVAMTGDGVNDILALKKADCSITMANGSQAAQNVSQLVMLDSNFGSLPSVVAEGRRIVNNLKRTSSLFLVKTAFAATLSLIFIITKLAGGSAFPFNTNNLYLWEFVIIGVGAFFSSLEPNAEIIKGHFLANVLKSALPGATTVLVAVGAIYFLYIGQTGGWLYTAVYDNQTVITMCTLLLATIPYAHFFTICSPFSKYRKFVFGLCLFLTAAGIGLMYLLEPYFSELFMVYPRELDPLNYVEMFVIAVGIIGIYLFIINMIRIFQTYPKEEKKK